MASRRLSRSSGPSPWRGAAAAGRSGAAHASPDAGDGAPAGLLPRSTFLSDESLDKVRPFLVVDPADAAYHTFKPATAVVAPDEERGEFIIFATSIFVGLVPAFSDFFMEFLMLYGLWMTHLTPNAIITLAVFAHICEAFVGVMPSVAIFRRFFKLPKTGGSDPVGSVRLTIRSKVGYIDYAPQLKIEKWKRQ